MILSFEGESLEACIGEMRAFLALYERRSTGAQPSTAGGAYIGPALPACPVHLREMRYVPAGTGHRGSFSASYRCPDPQCREAQWLEEERPRTSRRSRR